MSSDEKLNVADDKIDEAAVAAQLMGKAYLGDAVYVEVESGTLKLTTERIGGGTHVIYLEPDVFEALRRYYDAAVAAFAKAAGKVLK